MPDKMTDNEIKKALEDIIKHLDFTQIKSGENVLANALDLINRLQAENKRLSTLAELGNTRANDYRVMRDRALKAEAENERLEKGSLKEAMIFNSKTISNIKAEVYKEFDERLKEDCLSYPLEKDDLTMLVDVGSYNNLLKELVGKNQ